MTEEERKEKATRILRQITRILADEHVTLFDAKMLFTSVHLALLNSTGVSVVEHCDWDTLFLPHFNQIESSLTQ